MSSEEESSSITHPKRPRTQYHPLQRRKVEVPNNDTVDAYALSAHFWHDLIAPLPHSQIRRPWPSSQVLFSTITAAGTGTVTHKFPFLQAFYDSLGIHLPTDEAEHHDTQNESLEVIEMSDMEDLDNPTLSTLTPSQHRRYLKLVQQTERRTPSERIHWKQLSSLVPTEQAKYRQAVQEFWIRHKDDRLLLGLQTSSKTRIYCQWACAEHHRHNDQMVSLWNYGKCRQVLSLRSAAVNEKTLLDVATLDLQPVEKCNVDKVPVVSMLPSVGTRVVPPRDSIAEIRLSDDTKALELANQHGVDLMTTDRTMETLLKVPGDFTTHWLLPVVRHDDHKIIVMEIPLAQVYANPRDCLTRGIQEGLLQQMTSHNQSDTQDRRRYYAYALWTLPTSTSTAGGRRSKPIRVLIRSTVRLFWNAIPLQIRAHVDFFPERGQELASRYERSLWILDQILGYICKLCRVDGRNGAILEWQDTSVAHAFAAGDDDPMQGFTQLVQFFYSVSTIDFSGEVSDNAIPSRLLCLPSRENGSNPNSIDPYSVSVHAPSQQDVAVDLRILLENADGVSLNAKALEECYRPWKWNVPDRIPYTFPASGKSSTSNDSSEKRHKKYR